jgi:hypothetical protein
MNWFGNVQMSDEVDWLIVGDFNLLRKPDDRNRPGGNIGLVHFPLPTQNISSSTHHIKSFDACMEH